MKHLVPRGGLFSHSLQLAAKLANKLKTDLAVRFGPVFHVGVCRSKNLSGGSSVIRKFGSVCDLPYLGGLSFQTVAVEISLPSNQSGVWRGTVRRRRDIGRRLDNRPPELTNTVVS
ncbi:hypothetical protein BaRGS_00017117 [Batillaria attramentaria]|uniref:Uncharacterized protein n=1 Tax=Batillaria attramentaria TaxID=370345 RepID=A0ABD0KXV5_9CAEN